MFDWVGGRGEKEAGRAEFAADALNGAYTDFGHLLHMPSHMFIRYAYSIASPLHVRLAVMQGQSKHKWVFYVWVFLRMIHLFVFQQYIKLPNGLLWFDIF